jgi:hypothetical protein
MKAVMIVSCEDTERRECRVPFFTDFETYHTFLDIFQIFIGARRQPGPLATPDIHKEHDTNGEQRHLESASR